MTFGLIPLLNPGKRDGQLKWQCLLQNELRAIQCSQVVRLQTRQLLLNLLLIYFLFIQETSEVKTQKKLIRTSRNSDICSC